MCWPAALSKTKEQWVSAQSTLQKHSKEAVSNIYTSFLSHNHILLSETHRNFYSPRDSNITVSEVIMLLLLSHMKKLSSKIQPFKPGAGKNITLHASPTERILPLCISHSKFIQLHFYQSSS